MGFLAILLSAVALAMDAFAVSVCKGLSTLRLKKRHYLCVGLWFGGFQALMPTIGYFLVAAFEKYISAVDHWIAFALLLLIGANMIREALSKEEEKVDASFGVKTMLLLAVATSIDALAVGISFALTEMKIHIALAALIIGVVTFLLSALGLKIGNVFGSRFKNKAEFAGGVILILLGVKILLEGLGVLNLGF